jgi:23S rRNA pseudouridine1911/1915/1917 synthase
LAELRLSVPASLAGERLDRALALLTGRSRSEVAAWVTSGRVAVAGRRAAGSRRLREGEELVAELSDAPPAPGPAADPGVELDVVAAEAHYLVVDKPAGLVVHPGAGHAGATLVNGLLARFPELAGVGDPARPGLVHRLDKGTSGLMVVARTPRGYEGLRAQLARRQVERRYLALASGLLEPSAGVVEAPVGRSPRRPTAMAVTGTGRPARTRFRALARYERGAATLVECWLDTGRTHQVRVHLAAVGHPLVGDPRYGGPPGGLGRPFLHAHRLSFDDPGGGGRASYESPLPAELSEVLDRLGAAV